jgi:hypothetical protein
MLMNGLPQGLKPNSLTLCGTTEVVPCQSNTVQVSRALSKQNRSAKRCPVVSRALSKKHRTLSKQHPPPLAVFLASNESAWITGEVIRAAGGIVVAT